MTQFFREIGKIRESEGNLKKAGKNSKTEKFSQTILASFFIKKTFLTTFMKMFAFNFLVGFSMVCKINASLVHCSINIQIVFQ